MDFTLRLYEPRFNFAIQELFYAAVHNISTRFYRDSDHVVGFGTALCPHLCLHAAEQRYVQQCYQSMAQTHVEIGLLDHLFVAPAAQGNHIASALCLALERYMQELHCDLIFVHASHAAQPVFAHFGYQQIVELQNELQGMIITNNLMAKQILPAKM